MTAACISASVVASNLPTCSGETVEVAVIAADVIALGPSSTLRDKHSNVGQTIPRKEIVVKGDVLKAKVRSLSAVIVDIY